MMTRGDCCKQTSPASLSAYTIVLPSNAVQADFKCKPCATDTPCKVCRGSSACICCSALSLVRLDSPTIMCLLPGSCRTSPPSSVPGGCMCWRQSSNRQVAAAAAGGGKTSVLYVDSPTGRGARPLQHIYTVQISLASLGFHFVTALHMSHGAAGFSSRSWSKPTSLLARER
jgi:hypothetical protein